MKRLTAISDFWNKLNTALSGLIDAINQRTPQQGNGISINETPSGFLISLRAAVPIPTADGGSGLTADQKALLAALASDPGINGTFPVTNPPTDHSHATVPGTVEWLPWKTGATTGMRRITYLAPFTNDFGQTTNFLYDVWCWTGVPFNPRSCDANTFGGS